MDFELWSTPWTVPCVPSVPDVDTGSTHLVSGVTVCAVCCNFKYRRAFIHI